MWFIFLLLLLLLNVLSPGNGVPRDFKSTALILYPPAALDYFQKTTAKPDCECLTQFKKLPKPIRINVCYKFLVDATPYAMPEHKTSFVNDNFRTLVELTYEAVPDPFIEELSFGAPDEGLETSGQWCIKEEGYEKTKQDGKEQWAVASGLHQGVVFVFKKSSINKATSSLDNDRTPEFELVGLSEEIPYFRHKLSEQQLVKRYMTGDNDVIDDDDDEDSISEIDMSDPTEDSTSESHSLDYPENEFKGTSKSLCNLNEYERLRLCAVTHLALSRRSIPENLVNENRNEPNIVEDDMTCLQGDLVVESKRESTSNKSQEQPTQTVSLPIEVLSCSVIEKGTKNGSELLLTNDPHYTDSVFVVKTNQNKDDPPPPSNTSDKIISKKFQLKHFMTNLRVLKPFTVRF